MKTFQFITFCIKLKSLRISFNKIDGFIIAFDGKNKQLILCHYGLNILKVKKVVLQIVQIKILERSELIQIIPYLLKKY